MFLLSHFLHIARIIYSPIMTSNMVQHILFTTPKRKRGTPILIILTSPTFLFHHTKKEKRDTNFDNPNNLFYPKQIKTHKITQSKLNSHQQIKHRFPRCGVTSLSPLTKPYKCLAKLLIKTIYINPIHIFHPKKLILTLVRLIQPLITL